MPFPEVNRVIYRKNPLQLVVCQLRFPPILRVDAEIPAKFQEKIRGDFPNFSETTEVVLPVPEGIEAPPEIIRRMTQSSGIKNYTFSSEDGIWKVSLTRTFLALSTNAYHKWEEFRAKLLDPLRALLDEYSPTYFSRVGLRYVNMIKRSTLDLKNVDWDNLLKPYVLGVIGSPDVGADVRAFEGRYEIVLEDGKSTVRLVTKLAPDPSDGETCFVLDNDFFIVEKTGTDDVMEKLNFLNTRSSRLIQWAITPQLHQVMEPEEL